MDTRAQTSAERRRIFNRISARLYADLAAALAPPLPEVRATAEEIDGVVTVRVHSTQEEMDLETFRRRYPNGYISPWFILELDPDKY